MRVVQMKPVPAGIEAVKVVPMAEANNPFMHLPTHTL
jgi:hypothetical protein